MQSLRNSNRTIQVSTDIALNVPAAVALPALETILEEFKRCPAQAALALNMRDLHLPFEALVSVPIQMHIARLPSHGRNEWGIRICAAARPQLYPTFEGVLRLLLAGDRGSEVQLAGEYRVPLGPIGNALDATLFSGIAEQSLRRFVRDLTNRIAALARWAHLA